MNPAEYNRVYPGDRLRITRSCTKRLAELSGDLIRMADAYFLDGGNATVPYLQGDPSNKPLAEIFVDKFREWTDLSCEVSEALLSVYDFRLTHGYDPSIWQLSQDGKKELADLQSRGLVDQAGRTSSQRIRASLTKTKTDCE